MGAGVSGDPGQITVLNLVEKWKDLEYVPLLVQPMVGNIAREEIMRFNHAHVLVRTQ